MKTTKKIMASALALTMAASAGIGALADSEPIKTSGGSATVPVTITSALKEGSSAENPQYDAPVFRVTLPASLPLTINADGTVTTPKADVFQIINGSAGSVKVTNVEFKSGETWEFAPYGSDFDEMQVNAHKLGLSLTANDVTVKTGDEEEDLKPGWTVAKGASLGITAAAKASAVSATVTETNAASVIFTVGWNAAAATTTETGGEKQAKTTYTVTFVTGKSDSTVEPQTVKAGETAIKPARPVTSEGKYVQGEVMRSNFAGWHTNEHWTELYDFSTPVTDDIVIYARWTTSACYDDSLPLIADVDEEEIGDANEADTIPPISLN